MHGITILSKDWKGELDSGSFIRSIEETVSQEKMKSILSPAVLHEKVISEENLKWLYAFAFSGGGRFRHNENGTVFISGNLKNCYTHLKSIIDSLLPGAAHSPVVDGNFFITPSQYGLHSDSLRKQDFTSNLNHTPEIHERRAWVPWKNIIIPLWVTPPQIDSQICFFEQRHLDWAHVYNHGSETTGISTTYPIIKNMYDVQFYNAAGKPIDKKENLHPYPEDHFTKYFRTPEGKNLTSYKRFTGLKPEKTFSWRPGDLMVFDPCQLHATNSGANTGKPWTLKMGLLLKFLYPLN